MKSSDMRDDRQSGSCLLRRKSKSEDAAAGESTVDPVVSSPTPIDSDSRRLSNPQRSQGDTPRQPSPSAARAAIRGTLEGAVIAGVVKKQVLESGNLRYRLTTGEVFDLGNDGLTRGA